MPSSKTITGIVFIIILLAAVFFAYRFFLNKYRAGEESPGLTRETAAAAPGADAAQKFLDILLNLQKIELKDDFFQNPFFGSLVDFSPDVAAQTPGRANPFLPLAGGK